jgi:uncharacterized protein (DUF2235 family)
MSRNVVVCCDGTANEFAEDRTNVVKLYYCWNTRDPTRLRFIIRVWERWNPRVR